jgi:hypothetical protein
VQAPTASPICESSPEFGQIEAIILSALQCLGDLSGAMRANQGSWRLQPRKAEGLSHASESLVSSARAFIVSSLFLMGLASAMLFGGHAALDPLLQSAIAARDPQTLGDVVYTMPDRVYCRHLSFDNVTGDISETSIDFCPDQVGRQQHGRSARGFAWGERH